MSAVEAYTDVLVYFSAFGLWLDMIGAVMVLGPELPTVARALTKYERYQLQKLADKLKQGETVTAENTGFPYLRTAIGQGFVEGPTDRPFKPDPDDPRRFYWTFGEIEGMDEYVQIRGEGGSPSKNFTYEKLMDCVENYTARERAFFEVGIITLIAGFFFQLSAEIAEFNTTYSLVFFVVVGPLLSYFAIKTYPAGEDVD